MKGKLYIRTRYQTNLVRWSSDKWTNSKDRDETNKVLILKRMFKVRKHIGYETNLYIWTRREEKPALKRRAGCSYIRWRRRIGRCKASRRRDMNMADPHDDDVTDGAIRRRNINRHRLWRNQKSKEDDEYRGCAWYNMPDYTWRRPVVLSFRLCMSVPLWSHTFGTMVYITPSTGKCWW